MFSVLLWLIVTAQRVALSTSATLNDCQNTNCMLLNDDELAHLLSASILTQQQVDHLTDRYYSRYLPAVHSAQQNPEDSMFWALVYNSLYLSACSLCMTAYLVLVFWLCSDSPFIQITLSMACHYILHMLAEWMSHSMSTSILSGALYMCCCHMPSICVFICLFHPSLMDGRSLLQTAYDVRRTVLIHAHELDTERIDVYLVQREPVMLFVDVILLCLTTVVTSAVYGLFLFNWGRPI